MLEAHGIHATLEGEFGATATRGMTPAGSPIRVVVPKAQKEAAAKLLIASRDAEPPEEPPAPTSAGRHVVVEAFPDRFQATMVRDILQSHGLRARIINTSSRGGAYASLMGRYCVEVPEKEHPRALKVIGSLALGDADEEADEAAEEHEGAVLPEACPRCGAKDLYPEPAPLWWHILMTVMLFGLPLIFGMPRHRTHHYTCAQCGFSWKAEGEERS
jgi:DNA-directed RNA polymerase subunit M/transcription elongation factor TFIIS